MDRSGPELLLLGQGKSREEESGSFSLRGNHSTNEEQREFLPLINWKSLSFFSVFLSEVVLYMENVFVLHKFQSRIPRGPKASEVSGRTNHIHVHFPELNGSSKLERIFSTRASSHYTPRINRSMVHLSSLCAMPKNASFLSNRAGLVMCQVWTCSSS